MRYEPGDEVKIIHSNSLPSGLRIALEKNARVFIDRADSLGYFVKDESGQIFAYGHFERFRLKNKGLRGAVEL